LIAKQANFAYVNHTWIHSWNQPVLSNEGSFLLNETTGACDVAQTHDWQAYANYESDATQCTIPPLDLNKSINWFHFSAIIFESRFRSSYSQVEWFPNICL